MVVDAELLLRPHLFVFHHAPSRATSTRHPYALRHYLDFNTVTLLDLKRMSPEDVVQMPESLGCVMYRVRKSGRRLDTGIPRYHSFWSCHLFGGNNSIFTNSGGNCGALMSRFGLVLWFQYGNGVDASLKLHVRYLVLERRAKSLGYW